VILMGVQSLTMKMYAMHATGYSNETTSILCRLRKAVSRHNVGNRNTKNAMSPRIGVSGYHSERSANS
jgi:hypothetical protein